MEETKFWCHGSSFIDLDLTPHQYKKSVFRDKTKIAKFTNDMALENIPCTAFHEGWEKWVG